MLGWIWIYEKGKIKIKFDTLYYYLDVLPGNTWKIQSNTCSRKNKDLGVLVNYDYRNLSLEEIYKIIFIEAPQNEKEIREREYRPFGQMDFQATLFWYPTKFLLDIDNYGFPVCIWRKLPWVNKNKRIRDIIGWFMRSKPVPIDEKYIGYNTFKRRITVPFSDFIWFLKSIDYNNLVEILLDDEKFIRILQ